MSPSQESYKILEFIWFLLLFFLSLPKTEQKFPAKASITNAEQSPIHHPALTSYSETPEILQKDFSVFSNILMMQG